MGKARSNKEGGYVSKIIDIEKKHEKEMKEKAEKNKSSIEGAKKILEAVFGEEYLKKEISKSKKKESKKKESSKKATNKKEKTQTEVKTSLEPPTVDLKDLKISSKLESYLNEKISKATNRDDINVVRKATGLTFSFNKIMSELGIKNYKIDVVKGDTIGIGFSKVGNTIRIGATTKSFESGLSGIAKQIRSKNTKYKDKNKYSDEYLLKLYISKQLSK